MSFIEDSKKELNKYFKINPSVIILIFSNVITILFAIIQKWDFITVIWVYWFQNIIIGFFTFIKILNLKNFTTENVYINQKRVKPTKKVKTYVAFFFAAYYGFFHLGYLIFIALATSNFSNISFILLSSAIFFGNHLFSFFQNYKNDTKKKQNIGTAMFFPYTRIIPMHLIMIFGFIFFNNQGSLMFFLILKTFADLIMHQIEHR